MRGGTQLAAADRFARGHALIQNLRNGFAALTAAVTQHVRLATAGAQLMAAI